MNNKNKIIISGLLIIICFVIILVCVNFPKETKKDKSINKGEVVEDVIKNVFFNPSTTNDDIKKVIGTYLPRNEIFIGKDSVLRKKPSEDVIKKNELEKYETIQNEYAVRVENKYNNNTKYEIVENTDNNVLLHIKPWYYYQYTNDLLELEEKIFINIGYDYDEEDYGTEEYEVYDYKARVIAMRIMDKYLDNYDNKSDETRKVRITYEGNQEGKSDYFTLYLVFSGYTTQDGPSVNDTNERIEKYLNEAIESGLLNEEHPLEIE